MKRLLIIFILFISTTTTAQEKYALLLTEKPRDTASINYAENDLGLMNKALQQQGFKPGNIINYTAGENKTGFHTELDKLTAKLRKNDFVLLYFDISQEENAAGKNPEAAALLSADQLAEKLNAVSKRLNDPGLFFSIFSGSREHETANGIQETAFPLNGLIACRRGEKKIYSGNSSLFIRALSSALTTGSSYINSYTDLLRTTEKTMLLYTSRQHPELHTKIPGGAVFNNRFIRAPVFFSVLSQVNENTIRINAGQNLTILPGTVIRFYPAGTFDTAGKSVAKGVVIQSDDATAEVQLEKKITDAKNLQAIAGLNEKEPTAPPALSFNTRFDAGGNDTKNKYAETILKEIKENPRLRQYIQLVNSGGDFQISDIGLLSKDSVSCTIIHPRTGAQLKDFLYAVKNKKLTYDQNEMDKYSELEEYLVRSAEWNYLSRLFHPVAELQLLAEMTDARGNVVVKENGFPVVYEKEEAVLTLYNPGEKRIYFSILSLRTDKSIKLLYPGLGEESSSYFIDPGKKFTAEPFTAQLPFGQEKLKIITSAKPVEPGELRDKNILTRRQGETLFLPEYINVQDFDYEIRSSLYATAKNKIKKTIKINTDNKKIELTNTTTEKVFFNVLQLQDNGNYKIILPGKKQPAADCMINPGMQQTSQPEVETSNGAQFVFLFADRPFLLSDFETEDRTTAGLLTEIIRNGRIAGSALNKITIAHHVIVPKEKIVTRGNDILIKLINPRIVAERTTPLQTAEPEYTVNGFAFTDNNSPVQQVTVNGEPAEYDRSLKFFDKIIRLAAGKNKIVVEAKDQTGFTATQIIEVELKNTAPAAVNAKGINYFLGIAVDNYKVWPPLFNAKNDIINFSQLIEKKFGYTSDHFTLLLDTAATRRNIIRQIRSFLVKAKPNDNIIIYFSGHGNKDQLTDGDYYFIPSDAEADDISTAVKSTDIIDNFKNIRANNCLLIMDACFSGLISNSVNKQLSLANAGKNPLELPSKWILTSGRATKVSDGVPGTNSPFASVMLNYLRETNDQSKLTITKLIDYLKDNVPLFNKQQIPFGMSIAGEGEISFKIEK